MNRRSFLLLAMLAVFFAAGWTVLSLLPDYLQNRLIIAAAEHGVRDFRAVVERPGWGTGRVRALSIGPAENPGLSVEMIRFDFSLAGLLQRRLDRIEVSGLLLVLESRQGGWRVAGLEGSGLTEWEEQSFPGDEVAGAAPATEADGSPRLLLPALPARVVVIRDSALVVKDGPARYHLPLEARLENGGGGRWQAEAALEAIDRAVSFKAQADLDQGRLNGRLQGEVTDLFALSGLPFLPDGLTGRGRVNLDARAELVLASLDLAGLEAGLHFDGASLDLPGFSLQASSSPPAGMRLTKTADRWQLDLAGLAAGGGLPVEVTSLQVAWENTSGGGAGEYQLLLHPREAEWGGAFQVPGPVSVAGDFAVHADPGRPSFELQGEIAIQGQHPSGPRPVLQLEGGELFASDPRFRVVGERLDEGIKLSCELAAKAGRVLREGLQADSGELQGSGQALVQNGEVTAAAFELAVSAAEVTAGEIRLALPRSTVQGRLERPGGESVMALDLRTTGARVQLPEFLAAGLAFELPLAWPAVTTAPPGRLSVDRLQWRGQEMGTLNGTIRQQGTGLSFAALHVNRQIAGLKVHLMGRAGLENADLLDLEIAIPPFQTAGVALGRFSAAAAGLTAGGSFEGHGKIRAGSAGPQGSMVLKWRNGTLRSQSHDLEVEGIEIDLDLAELLPLASEAGQRLRFSRATLGKFSVQQGSFEFQVEQAGGLLVNQGEVLWGEGRLLAEAFRISPETAEYDLVLHGEGLKVAAILKQLGLARAEGEGRVSGSLPLRVRKGGLRFGEGYLVSDPGERGTLRLLEARGLAEAIPGGRPEFSQVDFALEALHDFEYNWIRFFVGSEGEDMLLRLQLDGRPAKPLPFAFRRDLGAFIRLEGQGEAGIVHPLRLDVNFRLPLDELLHYGGGIQKVMEQTR